MRRPNSRLALAASPLALATMLAAQPAVAQAFLGTPTAILGTINRQVLTGAELIELSAQQTTINWVPNDTGIGGAPINFLPTANSATFNLPGANGPWTVLNRIIAADPARAIQMSGSVNAPAFGRVWFYAPGGLLIGNGAQFNVGGLLLTANDPVGAAAGNPFIDATGSFRVQAAAGSTAQVNIAAGATIASGSYVIAVAPRFVMNGAATVGTSAALVAAEDVSFTLNGGLFDITTTVGTAAGGTSEVRGSITGPGGNSGGGVFSRIYMMAVPRNTAMTLLITGGAQLGFAIANAADIDGNAIVLSGGYDIAGTSAGQGLQPFSALPVSSSDAAANLRVEQATITSSLTMRSKDEAQVNSAPGPASFASDLQVFADGQALVRAGGGNTLTVAGSLLVDATTPFTGLNGGASRTAGTAEASANSGGSLQVAGNLIVLANGIGDDAFSPTLAGGTGTGGNALVNSFDGSISAGALFVEASGFGGRAVDGDGGSGIAGNARVESLAAGSLTVSGPLQITASGVGRIGAAGRLSGNAQGGTATLQLGGTVNVPGAVVVAADARYEEQGPVADLGGGRAQGGTAQVLVGSGTAFATPQLFISAASTGNGVTGNNSFAGGNAQLRVADSNGSTSVILPGGLSIDAGALASDGNAGGNVDGGSATGGFAGLIATGNPFLQFGGDASVIAADATGGTGNGGIGGAAAGGQAHLDMQNGGTLLQPSNLILTATAMGGSGTTGGAATAFDNGDLQPPAVLLRYGPDGGVNDQGIQVAGIVTIDASATGGNGVPGVGGAARGGFGLLRVESRALAAPSLAMNVSATGGRGGNGGNARSGRMGQRIVDADLAIGGTLSLIVDANGGDANNGDGGRGGDATVGESVMFISSLESGPGANVTATDVVLQARVTGGRGASGNLNGGAGGNAFGADPLATLATLTIGVQPARSTFTTGSLLIDNQVTGGDGGLGFGVGSGGNGGNARGGFVNAGVISGPVTPLANRSAANFGALSIAAQTTGGTGGGVEGSGPGGRGGDAIGGNAVVLARGGIVTASDISIGVTAQGGAGGNATGGDLGGGNATGGVGALLGTPHVTTGLAAEITVGGAVTITAEGVGGQSASTGGTGTGGSASVELRQHEAPGAPVVPDVGDLAIGGAATLQARGLGGNGGVQSGNGAGGRVNLIADAGTVTITGLAAIAVDGNALAGPLFGTATGGDLAVTFSNGGSLNFGGPFQADGRGRGQIATGGDVVIGSVGGGTLDVNGNFDLNFDGFMPVAANGAQLTGGTMVISTSDTSLIDVAGDIILAASGVVFGSGSGFVTNGGSIDWAHRGTTIVGGATILRADGVIAFNGGSGRTTGGQVRVNALSGSFTTAGLTLRALAETLGATAAQPALGGSIGLETAAGATITVGGAALLNANANAGTLAAGDTGAATGGSINVDSRGVIRFTSTLTINAQGTGGLAGGGAGGNGRGGSAALRALPGGELAFGGPVDLRASGTGGNGLTGGGTGTGGSLLIESNGGAITGGATLAALLAEGLGGGSSGTGSGGDGVGGTATVTSSGGGTMVFGALRLTQVRGVGGSTSDGPAGDGTAGTITITATGASMGLGAIGLLSAVGSGGNASGLGDAGRGQGGTARISALSGATVTIASGSDPAGLGISAVGVGGISQGGVGGDGLGGTAAIAADTGSVLNADVSTSSTPLISLRARGIGGSGTNGGNATGGIVTAASGTGSTLGLIGALELIGEASGGDGQAGNGGTATGGSVTLGGPGRTNLASAGGFTVQALALGGTGGGGTAQGGNVAITFAAGSAIALPTSPLLIDASGLGGGGVPGANGSGGAVSLATATDLNLGAGLELRALGQAGGGSTPGDALGGTAILTVSAGTTNVAGSVTLVGEGLTGAGNGSGGATAVNVTGGTLDVSGDLLAFAGGSGRNATGGGINLSSAGVIDIAGAISLQAASGGNISDPLAILQGGSIVVSVAASGSVLAGGPFDANVSAIAGDSQAGQARGGSFALTSAGNMSVGGNFSVFAEARHDGIGAAGGDSQGGDIGVTLTGGALSADSLLLSAVGTGGDTTSDGGDGLGGTIAIAASGGAQLVLADALSMAAGGFGGNALAGGAGGAGNGGSARVQLLDAGTRISAATGFIGADAVGGSGGSGGNATGGLGVLVVSGDGTAAFGSEFAMSANADGGSAGTGAGGQANGGSVQALTVGTGPATLTLSGPNGFSANARGGNGGGAVAGGAGGFALAGSVRAGSAGNGGTVTMGATSIAVNATGGTGGIGSATGGTGGLAVGGSAALGMARDASSATPGSFALASADISADSLGGAAGAGSAPGQHATAQGGTIRLIVNGAAGAISGGVRLSSRTFAGGFAPGIGAPATGGRIEVGAADAGNGSAAGALIINGAPDLQMSTQGSTTDDAATPGVVRLFASGAGSRLALGGLNSFNSGTQNPANLDRSGIMAGVGAAIDFGGPVTFVSRGDIGLNDGGTISAAGDMFVSSGGRVLSGFAAPTAGATGVISAPRLEIASTTGIDLATNTTGSNDVFLNGGTGAIRVIDIDANRDVTLNGIAGVAFTSVRADRNLGLFSNVAINGGSASAGGRLLLLSDGSITAGALDSGITDPAAGVLASVYVRALGPITVGAVSSARDAGLVAQGALTTGAITTARHAVLLTGSDLTTGAVATGATSQFYVGQFGQRSSIVFDPDVPPDYTVLLATAPQRLPGSISIGGDLATGTLQLAATGAILFGGTVTATSVSLDSGSSIGAGGVDADDNLSITSGGTVTLGDTAVGGAIRISSGAAITTGALGAGTHVVLTSPGLVTTGAITALGSVILSGVTGVTSGAISAGNGIVLLDTGGITTGALSTSPQGFVQISSHQQLPQITFDQAGNPIFAALLAAVPQRLDGQISIDGRVQTGRFIAAATGPFSAQAITAPGRVLVDVGGLASLRGTVASAEVVIRSADIAIAADVAIGQTDGSVRLLADSAATAMTVGGAGAQAGYSLSNAEFAALRAGNILIERPTGALNVEALTLAATAPVGSGTDFTLGGSLGTGAASGSPVPAGITLASSGVLRVNGAVAMAQATAASRLTLSSGTRIEVVQGSGSIRLGSDAENPAGTLGLAAPQVRVATAALLAAIADGSLAGDARVTALNAAQAGGAAVGSIAAGSIGISASGDVLIQNSGGPAQKAGFTAGAGGLMVTRTGSGLVDLVVNGRVLVAGIGFAVNNATVDEVAFLPGAAGFAATSTVNGCVIGGACGTPDALLDPVITLLTSVQPLTFEVQEQRARLAQPADKLPIMVLQRLFDFGPMFSDVDATDPVTSGGNPALWLGLEPTDGSGEQK